MEKIKLALIAALKKSKPGGEDWGDEDWQWMADVRGVAHAVCSDPAEADKFMDSVGVPPAWRA